MIAVLSLLLPARAESVADLGGSQRLRPEAVVRVDIVDAATETIHWEGSFEDPVNGLVPASVTLYSPAGVVLGVFPSGSDLPASAGVGTYRLDFEEIELDGAAGFDPIEGWEITVEAGGSPIPGRVWSTEWRFDTGSFTAAFAMDGSFYAVVPGGAAGSDGVVELKADGLSGFIYSLTANQLGIDDGEGRSRFPVSEWNSDAVYRVYLLPPDPAFVSYSWITPSITGGAIAPTAPCGLVVPGLPGGDATIAFDSNVDGIAHFVCDLDRDGVFDLTSDDDFHLLRTAAVGANAITWDGLDNLGQPVAGGSYDCVVKLTVGEFHYVADDIETSYEGFRLFELEAGGARRGLPMYWNDAEVMVDPDSGLARDVLMPNLVLGLETSGANGVFPGLYADAAVPNVNARSWGAFRTNGDPKSKGDEALLDTYAWLADDDFGPVQVDVADLTVDTDADQLSDAEEDCLSLTDPADPDSDGDGAGDFVEWRDDASDPLDPDSDADGLLDGDELAPGGAPRDSDGDGDFDGLDPDDDGDGVGTLTEGAGDADDDLLPNHLDDDDDDDGVDTIDEDWDGSGDWTDDDADGDGTPDFLDGDDDGDGLPIEVHADSDGDGLPDTIDADDDGDGVPTGFEYDRDEDGLPDDADGDTVPNWLDPDDDDDGLLTALEIDPNDDGVPDNDGDTDTDGDGAPDFLDPDADDDSLPDGVDLLGDIDGDGVPGFQDDDDDGDELETPDEFGLLAVDRGDCEGFEAGGGLTDDTDGDGTPDYADDDDDDDGIPTADEWDTNDDGVPDDADGDGVPNYRDCDDDGDGIPTDQEGSGDTDMDGVPDFLDLDADNDSLTDRDETTFDSDGDLRPDFQDNDDDDDGIGTFEELADPPGGYFDPDDAPDSDGDRDPDYLDDDDDDDGIPTSQEGDFGDDADGDGTSNHLDLDSDADTLPDELEGANDRDGDGDGNFVDLDSDGDGYDDALEGDADSDGDDTADFLDDDDDDDGVRSLEEVDGDTDGDGTPDRLDTDDDGDGISTRVEVDDALVHGDDVDEDGAPSWVDTDSDDDGLDDAEEKTADEDGDGVPNYLDPDGAYSSWYRGSGLSVACSGTGAPPLGLGAALLALAVCRRRRDAKEGR